MEQRLLGHIDSRLADGGPSSSLPSRPATEKGSRAGPRVYVGSHPRSGQVPTPPAQPSPAAGGDTDSLHTELNTELPPSPPSTFVEVKLEPDSDVEIIDTPTPPPSPPRLSRVAQAAAEIDPATCRTHVRQACQVLGKEPGTLPDHAYESTRASALTSLRHFRDAGLVTDPEVKIAWPHDDCLDKTQQDFIASLQHQDGPKPARDLFAIPPPPKGSERFLPLPSRRVPRDQWFYMSQTAAQPSWGMAAPKNSVLDPHTKTPQHYILPSSQFLAQESNLRQISHLATMTNNAAMAVSEVIFHLYEQGLWPSEPITMPGVDGPITFPWFLSLSQLIGSSTSQIAHNAVCAAMNLQLARREVFLHTAGNRTRLISPDRDLMRVAPMDADDLFGRQASDLQDRRALFDPNRHNRNYNTAARASRPSATVSAPPQAQAAAQPSSSSSSRRRRRNRSRSQQAQAPAQAPANPAPPASQQQPFRGGSSRGGGRSGGSQSSSRNRGSSSNQQRSGSNQQRSGGSGRGRSRSTNQ